LILAVKHREVINIPIINNNHGFFRVFLMSSTNGWLPEVLIILRGDINPLDYSEEVYKN
jgi:hypothetical protein